MMRKQLNQSEFMSALDFVKTDIDNLRAYFEQGAISPTNDVVTKAGKLKSSVEMLMAMLGETKNREENQLAKNLEAVLLQNKAIAMQNEQILNAIKTQGGNSSNTTLLSEILNVKESVSKISSSSNIQKSQEDISDLKRYIAQNFEDSENRISKNIEYQTKSSMQELAFSQRPQQPRISELSAEIAIAKDDVMLAIRKVERSCEEYKMQVESSSTQNQIQTLDRLQTIECAIEGAKDEIIYNQRTEEISNLLKTNKKIQGDTQIKTTQISEETEKLVAFARTNMQVLRSISKQLIGVYQAEKTALSNIEKGIFSISTNKPKTAEVACAEEDELSKGFSELKDELQNISNIIKFQDIEKISNPNEGIKIADSYANQTFEPQGLMQTAKDLQMLATELCELDKIQEEAKTTENN